MSKYGEPVFLDGTVVGYLRDGVFFQRITARHIYRMLNARGMDLNLYRQLKGQCHTWRLERKDTKEVLSIPFDAIERVGIQHDAGAGYGKQIFVKLEEFTQEQPPLQPRLL